MKRIRSGGVIIAGAIQLVTMLCTAPSADAQVKYNRKTKEIKVDQTDRTKKLDKKDAKPAGPDATITADKFYQIQGQIQGDLDELIKTYKEQLADIPADDPFRLKYGFRLAEAYANKQRFHHGLQMEAVMKADKAPSPAEKVKQQSEAATQKKLENDALKNAIVAYGALIKDPNIVKFPQGDEILFYYAYTLQRAERAELAGEIYKQLLKQFQGSKFVPDAYLYFADRYFEDRDLTNAEAFYGKVLQFPKSQLYPYAIYKRAWVYYNQKRVDEAMRGFRETVRLTNGQQIYGPMNKAAKKDFVRMYAESDAPVNVGYQAFQALDKSEYSFKMLGFLGDYYMDQGKADKAIYVFHQMIAMKPKDALVCEWQYNVARATMSAGSNTDKVRELSNLVKLYTSLKSWQPAMPQQNFDECRENAAGVTGELAMLWHAEAIKTLNFQTLGDAEQLYKVYLEHFPDASNSLTMQVNYSELLWTRATMEKDSKLQPQRWEATAAEHSKVVQWKGVDEAQRKDSAYATVLAWKNALAVDVSTEAPDDNKEASAPEPIPDKEQKMMKAFDVYLTYITDKKDDERTQILFFTGRLYWRHRHYDEAIKYLAEVVSEHPEHESALFAANLLLNALDRANRHEELQQWITRLAENKRLMAAHPALKNTLGGLYVQSLRKSAESLEKKNDYRACGFAYEKLQLENPNDPKISEILYNAAVCFRKAGMIGRAVAFRYKLTNRPGAEKDPLAQRAQFALGDDYTSIAMYEKAAEMYEAYAARFAAEKEAPKALFYAQFFRRGLGQDAQAIKDTEQYISKFSKKEPREAAGASYSIANVYEKNKETDKFVGHLQTYLKTWGDKGGVDVEIAAHVRAGEALWKQSCPVKGENGSCIEIKRERALRDAGRRGKRKATTAQTQCGDVSKNKITVYERKPQLVREAQTHFKRALEIWKRSGTAKVSGKDETDKAQRTADAIRWAAAAEFYLAEAKYEEFLGLKFPDRLNFDATKPAKQKDSIKRFKAWFDTKTKLAVTTSQSYAAIVDTATSGGANINAAQWGIAGAARMGQINQNFSDALFTAEIPKDVQAEQDTVDAYCDQLMTEADPLEKKSIEAFSFCLDSSNKLSWYNEWSQLCEAELAQIRPQDFPAAGEIRAQPFNVPPVLDSQPLLGDVRTSTPAAAPAPATPAPAAGASAATKGKN